MPKRSIREILLKQRRHLSLDTCLAKSLQAQALLLTSQEFAAATTIALYQPVHNEVFTETIFHEARLSGKIVVYPRVHGNDLEFVRVDELTGLAPGRFGILEPVGQERVSVASLDLLIVPGVAFDLAGYRLGYGKGFYDRALHAQPLRGALVGLAFEFQIVPELPAESHDIPMDLLVTEDRIVRTGMQPPAGG